jgi:hypothetical protein
VIGTKGKPETFVSLLNQLFARLLLAKLRTG